MDLFTRLEHLISYQSSSSVPPTEVLAEEGSPSTSVAILDHGEITSRCFSTIGDDTETVFQACSVSKPVAGMAIMRLVQQGRLNVEDKIIDLLPESVFNILVTKEAVRPLVAQITVKQLMSHTSGLAIHGFPGYSENPPDVYTILSGKKPSNTRRVCLSGLPGETFSYSGGGITVLQIILETITGKDFPSIMQELVLQPLGMSRSFYHLPNGEANIARAYHTGFTACEKNHILPEQAAAGLWTTPSDLLKIVRAFQKSLETEEGFLRQDIARQMITEIESCWGLTWAGSKDLGMAFGHGGSNNPGWRCHLIGYADLHFNGQETTSPQHEDIPPSSGICVMTNSAEGLGVLRKVWHAIAFLKSWPDVSDFDGFHDPRVPFAAPNAKVDARWRDWIGKWSDHWSIQDNEEGLPVVQYGNLPLVRLVPAAISNMKYSEGQSVDLLLDGLQILIRLGWKDGKRTVEIHNGNRGKITALERPLKDSPSSENDGKE